MVQGAHSAILDSIMHHQQDPQVCHAALTVLLLLSRTALTRVAILSLHGQVQSRHSPAVLCEHMSSVDYACLQVQVVQVVRKHAELPEVVCAALQLLAILLPDERSIDPNLRPPVPRMLYQLTVVHTSWLYSACCNTFISKT